MITEHASFPYPDPLQPEELDMLQRVFDVACVEAGIQKKSRQAEGLAATLLQLFQSGIHNEQDLEAALKKVDFI
ncbi:hypothetical protein J2X76_005515 [Neorhizobium sp. 2083]|uniref:hypothetical protein n=1 Tax=Neorhizobium sp. 2083 TaxID=2817762 RepID=UPI00286634B0|nr:hypothetical protein [Neorhizobium sp. 2083]MDR6820318.1 hypothetical protein [Neorhizobium sp. 2083]